MNEKRCIFTFIAELEKCVEASTSEDIEALLAGRARLAIIAYKKSDKKASKSLQGPAKFNTGDAIALLNTSDSREAGLGILRQANVTKALLEQVAKELRLPLSRSETVEQLRERIVESTIGSRLNSKAIRGEIDPSNI